MAKAKKSDAFEIDFDSYIRQGEPDKKEKSIAWAIATGLQQVDGLTPSEFLYKTAKRNIEGEITIEQARKLVDAYYESKTTREDDDDEKEEADKVSARIAQILKDKTFDFSPDCLIHIHGKIFEGVFKFAGTVRTYNITKKEWVLDGDTVFYSDCDMIRKTLDYDFAQEKNFNYKTLQPKEKVKHFARFIANIWQIHPFGEGNTRTTAVFAIKYLRWLGYSADNLIFEKNSWYFRNALVRANYSNTAKGVYMDTSFLEALFGNIMLGEQNELKNRYLHIRANELLKAKKSDG
ncbi:MAG: Fic family protein, partial [Treponema sp.]|nr:Fic family protein [Treponema sp.]